VKKFLKLSLFFANNSTTLFCEVSRCHKLANSDVLDPKNASKNFGTFGSFSYPLFFWGGVHFSKKNFFFLIVSKTTVNPYQKLKKRGYEKDPTVPKFFEVFFGSKTSLFASLWHLDTSQNKVAEFFAKNKLNFRNFFIF